jgi:hypothetical protein
MVFLFTESLLFFKYIKRQIIKCYLPPFDGRIRMGLLASSENTSSDGLMLIKIGENRSLKQAV